MDVVAPPPPARGSNADANDDAPSFQDHVDAADQHAQRTPSQTKGDAHPASNAAAPAQQSEAPTNAPLAAQAATQDESVQQSPLHPPVMLQLIAAVAPGVLGPTLEEQTATPQDATPGADQPAKADANQEAAVIVAAPPLNATPKADTTTTRPAHGKTKGATIKTSAPSAAEATPTAQVLVQPSQDTSAQPQAAAPIIAPTTTQADSKGGDTAKTNAPEGVQSTPTRAPAPKQPAPSPPAPIAPETGPAPQKSDASQAKGRDSGRALAPSDAVKQAAQDFAATPA